MDLILWRHAHAGDHLPNPVDDLARPLTAKGERQAERMAAWLHQRLTDSTRVLVSPARRTQQTVQALGRPFKTVDALGPGCSVQTLLSTVRFPHSREAVLVVGHQPTLGCVVSHLLAGQEPPPSWPMKKGAVWWLRWREGEGSPQLCVHAVMSPDML